MCECGTYMGVYYTVSNIPGHIITKSITYECDDMKKIICRSMRYATVQKIEEYIYDNILCIGMLNILNSYFRGRKLILFRAKHIFGKKSYLMSRKLFSRMKLLKNGCISFEGYEITVYTSNRRSIMYCAKKVE